MRLIVFEDLRKAANASGRQRIDRAGADAVDTDFLWAQVVGEIASACFKSRFGHAHHIVMWHDFFCPVIGHGDNAAAFGHQRCCPSSQRDERISTYIMGDSKGFAAGVKEVTFQCFSWSKSDGMEQQM